VNGILTNAIHISLMHWQIILKNKTITQQASEICS